MENIHENGTFQLHNKVEIPQVGFGTWQMPDGETAADAVMHAIEAGYTHIDTAAVYHNEIGVGAGIRMSGVPREKLFVTSKLWNDVSLLKKAGPGLSGSVPDPLAPSPGFQGYLPGGKPGDLEGL